jgi:hypothetical protein
MLKKVLGIILMLVGVFIALVLFISGTIFPHILGPVVFVSLGAFLVWFKRKGKQIG